MTEDSGDVDDTTRYEAFWAFRNRWLVTNIARTPERCMHQDTYDTESWSRCLACCYVIPRPTVREEEPSALEKSEHYVEYLMASGRIKAD
jgi:hypothetical protein